MDLASHNSVRPWKQITSDNVIIYVTGRSTIPVVLLCMIMSFIQPTEQVTHRIAKSRAYIFE